MGRRRKPWMRDVNGILLLDKPEGLSSNHALQRVRRLYSAAKAGHTGSLDPLATGMLPVCFGPCTKLSHYLLDADKHYTVGMRWGARTTTGDAEGEVVEENAIRPDAATVARAAEAFVGEIEQVPPMYSAVHHQGRRLYEIAREGGEVERPSRSVTIYALDVGVTEGDILQLSLRCSKGTYVRTLVEDLARACGALAYVGWLRRDSVGPFATAAMHRMDDVESAAEQGAAALDALLLPPSAALTDWPAVTLDAARAFYLSRGEAVRVAAAPSRGRVAIFGPSHDLLALGEIDADGMVAPRRMMQLPA
ncbi:tRNA pseudouridine(55) synthase TruB [Algiphilus sp. NNCM1]|uniref:tRNA pseudouridine(55) synthase TruB n=1 Tax=Algiphilus sp. TaxID=1872431 RepID=UPI001CA5F7F8|nr:tRNA pseudouridine(55) synthase TruB [Algiphilus sp.]MBY8966487.1 tRNA pseudouridine(55) synthase TruB [Algiphilus acroporae]MCI5103493.1 tRNA pseudouridine(55) synthase TruB [Algiphilus sp.]